MCIPEGVGVKGMGIFEVSLRKTAKKLQCSRTICHDLGVPQSGKLLCG